MASPAGRCAARAHVERLAGPRAGEIEVVRARHVVGCDGARSAVCTLMGRTLEGDSAGQAWGVMDVLAVTDSPDIGRKAAIQSASEGRVPIIPRDEGYLVRFHIELDKPAANQRVFSLNVTTAELIAAAQRILRPYTLEGAWWSVYEIGQRPCTRFDDLPTDPLDDRLAPVADRNFKPSLPW
ncbi:FAD-dependent monooxygenase [Silanimonas sp.]|jgi:phenol 2-monooxygenase|uniref:FAD-dependent monooxygenase n=1 Tax=Silanimonas sp. TaxID=1929290 RepID=UPI0022C14AA3|nr:FAD-dependent monooxygenase [Silanimonas sp.]MCZ8116424.1 FAD-dependent monooxygenase [Silanimonas sp.]